MPKMTAAYALAALFLVPSMAMAQEGDVAAGEQVFKKCSACHNVETDKNKVGPHLQNVFGRQPGALEGFKYSNAMVAFGEGKVWDDALMTEYLANPRGVVKGTRMAFAGLKDEKELADVIAYLKQFSTAQ
ncbi:cytochrome c family protein [Peteryoungia desertarenae]|uniref:Cytochrome c family protein n=1 Tax=Peteryoungia desertarenae TaxID=1813451 RepID=A0ABX6QJQ0_9HYPH|nr:cytochrome c family protein [Peteryoungia desertarenae]QLF68507.1 cytochrome c family protein [Peteryoungia desertarenae]